MRPALGPETQGGRITAQTENAKEPAGEPVFRPPDVRHLFTSYYGRSIRDTSTRTPGPIVEDTDSFLR